MSKTFYATFQGGQVVLDELNPQIPEGKRLKLVVPDNDTELEDDIEGLDEEERKALHAAIEEGIKEADAGETVPVEDLFAEFERRK